MVLQVKNMESDRCIAMVKEELNKLGLIYKNVELGEVEFSGFISGEELQLFDAALKNSGFELLDNKEKRLVEKIKATVRQFINLSEELPKQNFSDYIRKKVNFDYTCLSNIFSNAEGVTIEKYIIAQRVERAKELLVNIKLTISDISFKLQYSSVAHLSNQFKKVTGLTPSDFRRLWNKSQQSF